MKLNQVLETIASNARFTIRDEEILSTQTQDIRELFATGDSALLKSRLAGSVITADRTTIFQI